ncbi:acyl-coenzyme A synthetase [Seiridium cupressi]
MSRIYTHPTLPKVEIPNLDLLSLLFDSDLTLAQDDTVLHVDAASPEDKYTKAQLKVLIERVAYGLRENYGIGANGPNKDIVTLISYGAVMLPSLFYGVIGAGGVFSTASPSSSVSELERLLTDSKIIICDNEHVNVVLQAALRADIPKRNILILDSITRSLKSLDGQVDAISTNRRLPWQKITDPQALKESLIVILWSSGTTGLPKGVRLSHLNLVAETFICSLSGRAWAQKQMDEGTFVPVEYRSLAHLPTSHIAGVFGYFIAAEYSGGQVYWMKRYSWPDLLKYAGQHKITVFYTVPSIYLRISKSPDVTDQFSHLIGAVTGAAPMDDKLQQSANRRLGEGKHQMLGQTWGLSETTGAVTAVLADESDDTGSIGSTLPGIELRLVDEDFKDVEPGQEGELVLKGPVVTNGYYNNPQATKDAFHDGWFLTGDIGVMRGGKFFVVDRRKELLKYKGLQVAPAEIEGLLFDHPLIKEAAVIGLPDPSAGDLPRAYVVPETKGKISEGEVQQYVASKMAGHKQLRGGIVFGVSFETEQRERCILGRSYDDFGLLP